MNDVNSLKLIEAGAILLALGLFAWWQLRDVKRAQQNSSAERARVSRGDEAKAKVDIDTQQR
jgi:hypothetical protein